jgi:hypothetical protein
MSAASDWLAGSVKLFCRKIPVAWLLLLLSSLPGAFTYNQSRRGGYRMIRNSFTTARSTHGCRHGRHLETAARRIKAARNLLNSVMCLCVKDAEGHVLEHFASAVHMLTQDDCDALYTLSWRLDRKFGPDAATFGRSTLTGL